MAETSAARGARLRFRRPIPAVAAALALGAAVTFGRPDDGDAPAPPPATDGLVDLHETYVSPVLRRAHRVELDPATGGKRFVRDDGRAFGSIDEILAAETAGLSVLDRVVAPSLLERLRAPGAEADVVEVCLRMARQPATEVADDVGAREGPAIEASSVRLHEILGRLAERGAAGPDDERTLLDAAEQDELRRLRADVKTRVRAMRREVIDRAKPLALADQESVVAAVERVPGAVVQARTIALSAVCARLPAAQVEALVLAHPEIARAELQIVSEVALNTSVTVVGAPTWWSAGYDGSTSTIVAVLDSGIDANHPAFTGGIITAAAVYLSSASAQSNFADNASSTQPYHFHGTHVAGIVSSQNGTYKGVAPGARLMNAKCAYLTTSGGASLLQSDIMSAADWATDNGADVLNCSFGGAATTDGNTSETMFFDAISFDLAVAVAISAGNSGSSSGTICSPSDGFNVIGVGNFDDAGTTSTSDDSIASSSSRGPCSDGRRKPDISAPGTNITSAYFNSSSYASATGTSMAAPHVAGALAILEDAAVATYPEGAKALLLTNCRNTSPVPTSPDDNWGCGAMELSAVYTNRAALRETTMTSSGARYVFVKPASLSAGKRVTLTWPRRVMSNNNSSPSSYSTLLDLDLYVYDEADNSSEGSSASGVNSVEQVKLTNTLSTPVVKVYRASSSFPSGLSTQRIAVAVENSSSLPTVTEPTLSCSLNSFASQIAGSTNFTVQATISNTGGLAAQSPSVTLTLPTGYSIVSGANPQTVSRVTAGGSGTATWTVRSASSGSGTQTISAAATSSSYGETFTSTTGSRTQTLDTTAPVGTVTINGGVIATTSPSLPLNFAATDTGGTGVANMRWREAGGTWGNWTQYSTGDNITVSSGDGVKTVEAQFDDAVGNQSAIVSDTVYLDTVAPTGASVSVNSGAAWTTSTTVTLTLAASDATSGVSEMRFSNNNSTWTSWTTYSTSSSFTLTASDGTRTVYAQFRDYAGNTTSSVSDTIGLDRSAPTSSSVSVAAGAAWTAGTSATLTLASSDATSGVSNMRFSNDGSTWGSWITYATSSSWTLTTGDGTKTVYAQFRDAAGNATSSVTDTIGLDGTVPSGSVSIAGGAAWTTTTSVTLDLSASDATAGVADMRFSNDGTTWGSWVAYAATASWTLAAGDGTKTVYAQFRDAAGNVSANATDTIGLDGTLPTGTVSVNAGAAWTATTSATLTLSASDGGSGMSQMRFSNDGATWGSWITYATSSAWTLTTGDGTKTVYAQFRDVAGNVSSNATDTIGLDGTSPTGTVTAAGGAAWTQATSIALTLSGADAGSGVADMRFSNDGSTWGSWTTYSTAAAWTLASGDGAKTVYAQFRDTAGNVSSNATDAVGLDGTIPTGSLSIAAGAAWTAAASVTLTPSGADATSGVAEMRFSDDGSTWSAWAAYASSAAWTLPGADGAKTVYAQFRDAAGNVSSSVSDAIGLDVAAPSGTVVVAGGAAWTTTTSVTLTLSAADATSGVADMRFSNDGETWGSWAAYATSAAFTLTATDGARTVFAQFRDTAGNVSQTATDDVGLDRVAPTGSIAAAGGDPWTQEADVVVATSATDATSGAAEIRLSNDGATWSSWNRLGKSTLWTLSAGDGTKTVYAQFRDAAGNVSSTITDAIGLDATAPTGSISIAGGVAWTGAAATTLTVAGTDATSGVEEMRFSDDGESWSEWATYGTSAAWTLPGGDGAKTVYAEFRDVAGNVSTATISDDVGLDRGAPSGTVVVDGGAAWTGTTSVTLALSASDPTSSVAEMRFSNDGSTWGPWAAYATSAAFTLTATDGARTVYAQFKDAAGNVSSSVTDDVGLDRGAPSGTVVVDGGAAWTATTSVALTLSASDATSLVADMRFSNDGATWSAWTAYSSAAAWTLASGDGSKTVHAQFRDAAGNVSSSATDAVGLDGTAPTGTVACAGGAAWTGAAAITLTLSSSDATSGVAEMRFSDDGSTWSSWATYASSAPWTLPGADGAKTVYAQFRDAAGNVSSSASDSIGLDRAAPSGTIAVAADAAWTTTPSVTLNLSASDATSPVAEMRFSDDGATWSAWTAYAAAAARTLPAGDGTKSVFAQFRDAAGNVSATASDSIGLDVVAPTASVSVAGGAAWTGTADVLLDVGASDATSGVSQMRFSDDGATWSAWTAFAASAARTLPGADGAKTVYAQIRDLAGNVSSTASDAIGLDRAAPDGSLLIAGGAAWVAGASVTLSPSATDATSGVSLMRFSDDGSTWTTWTAYASSAPWTLPGADGTKTVYAQFRDVVGNVSTAVTDTIGIDRAAPGGTLVIAGGAAWTATSTAALGTTGSDATSGVAEMRFSDDGTNWSSWTPFAATSSRTLPGSDGAKTVYAQFRDAAGNASATVSDGIGLDRLAPTGTVVVNGDGSWTATRDVSLACSASDATSGVAEMRFANDAGAWSAWQPVAASASWTLAAIDGARTVRAQFRDVAGNVSAEASDSVGLDTTAPSGGVTIAGGAFATNADAVALGLVSSDATSGVVEMRLTNDGVVWSEWMAVADAASYALAPGEGVRTIGAQFRDAAGNVSTTATDDVLADRTSPTGSFVLAGGAEYLPPAQALVVDLSSDDGVGSGAVEFRWSHDRGAAWSAWTPGATGPKTIDLPGGEGDRLHEVLVQWRDVAGNVSASASRGVRLLSAHPLNATAARTISGALDAGGDVDDYRLDLQAGDRFDLKPKTKTLAKGAVAAVAFDLYAPDGALLFAGRFPETAAKPGVTGFVAATTGAYRLVVRGTGAGVGGGLRYLVQQKLRAAKVANVVGTGDVYPLAIAFEAAQGRSVAGTLHGALAAAAELSCPEGDVVPVALRAHGAAFLVPKVVLGHGSGAYVLRVPAGEGDVLPADWTLKVSPPKAVPKLVEPAAAQ